MTEPSLSVIVVTKDDRRFVRDCLDSIREQDQPVEELIVVDCGSVDGTPQLVASVDSDAQLLSAGGPEEARAAGLRAAAGDIVVLTTGRMRLTAGSLRRSVEALQSGGGDAVAGRSVAVGTTNFGRAAASIAPWTGGPPRPVAWFRTGPPPLPATAGAGDGVRAWWYAPQDVRQLAGESFAAGAGAVDAGLRGVPPLVALPALLVAASAVGAVAGRGWRRGVVPGTHLLVCIPLALRAGRDSAVAPHRAWLAITVAHWCTGSGLLRRLAGVRR